MSLTTRNFTLAPLTPAPHSTGHTTAHFATSFLKIHDVILGSPFLFSKWPFSTRFS